MGDVNSGQASAVDPPRRIFISYRRGDASGEAHALRERLVHRYGPHRVFMDTDSIPPGADFAKWINEELDSTGLMLVLIGRNWLGRGKSRRFDSPGDWVGLEIGFALERNIPMIPILVEGTPLPSREDLPEPLRPIVTKQTVPLDNNSFEADMMRVERAVATHIPDLEEGDKDAVRPGPNRRILYAAAGAVLIVAIIAGILLARPHPKPVPSVTASAAVLKVQSPDLLAESLLAKGFAAHLPANVSPNPAQLSDTPNGLTNSGLIASVDISLHGPASDIGVWYYVFQDAGTASQFFYAAPPYPAGYRPAAPFTTVGLGDHTKCETARQATSSSSSSWACQSLSGTVVSYSVVLGQGTDGGAGLEKELAPDTIRNLQTVAAATSHQPLGDPPGMTATMTMTGSDIYDSLANPSFPQALVPAGLSSPTLSQASMGAGAPSGLIRGFIVVSLAGHDYSDYVVFYVFGTPQQARSWFGDIQPEDPAGKLDKQTGDVSSTLSGFSSSQQAQCRTWSQSAAQGTPALGVSFCDIQWGNVVIDGQSKVTSNPSSGNTDVALALARAGELRVAQVITP